MCRVHDGVDLRGRGGRFERMVRVVRAGHLVRRPPGGREQRELGASAAERSGE